jgi:hypothetical protein
MVLVSNVIDIAQGSGRRSLPLECFGNRVANWPFSTCFPLFLLFLQEIISGANDLAGRNPRFVSSMTIEKQRDRSPRRRRLPSAPLRHPKHAMRMRQLCDRHRHPQWVSYTDQGDDGRSVVSSRLNAATGRTNVADGSKLPLWLGRRLAARGQLL